MLYIILFVASIFALFVMTWVIMLCTLILREMDEERDTRDNQTKMKLR